MKLSEFLDKLDKIGFAKNNDSPYILKGIRCYGKNTIYDELNKLLKDENFKIENFNVNTLICDKMPLAAIYMIYVDENVPEWIRLEPNTIVGGGTMATWWCVARNIHIKLNSINEVNIKLNNDCPKWMQHNPDLIISKRQQRKILDYYLLLKNIPDNFIPQWMIPKNRSIYTAIRFIINKHKIPPINLIPDKNDIKIIDDITLKITYLIYVNKYPIPLIIDDDRNYDKNELLELSKSKIFMMEDVPFPICYRVKDESFKCAIDVQQMN